MQVFFKNKAALTGNLEKCWKMTGLIPAFYSENNMKISRTHENPGRGVSLIRFFL